MKALQFNVNTARFAAAKILGAVFGKKAFYRGPARTIDLAEVPEPRLFTPAWVKIKTRCCGFCGSDANLITLHDSPTASPFTSFPCVIGHEMVGEIVETGTDVSGFQKGDLVAVNPTLSCTPRGIDPVCAACAAGRPGTCENFAEGALAPGMFLGINRQAPGGFAPFFAAHRSQLYKLPQGLSLESAVMTEPVAVVLQTVLDNMPAPGEKVLVIGAGVIGNLLIRAIRSLSPECSVFVIEPSAFAAELAVKAGAEAVIPADKLFKEISRITGARVYKPMIGMEIPMGGFARVYDTVAGSHSLNLSLRMTAGLGTLSVVGIGGPVKLDLTPLWLKLQTVKGVYAYGEVPYNGKEQHVFGLALELMKSGMVRADDLVTHRFSLQDYRQMLAVNLNKEKYRAMKTIVTF